MTLRLLTLDIETSPNLAHVWGLFKQNIGLNQLMESGQVISFAAKWHGDKKVLFYSDHHNGHDVMVQAAHDLLSEADAVDSLQRHQFRHAVVAHGVPAGGDAPDKGRTRTLTCCWRHERTSGSCRTSWTM